MTNHPIDSELDQLERLIAERSRALQPGVIGGIDAQFTKIQLQDKGVLYRISLTIEPFSEEAEVSCAHAEFTLTEDMITCFRLERGGVMEDQADLPATGQGARQLAARLKTWIDAATPLDVSSTECPTPADTPRWQCSTCNAVWTADEFTPDCEECGGGAMERECMICDGFCGATFTRMPLDSIDSHEAHWLGSCKLPMSEQQELMRRKLDDR